MKSNCTVISTWQESPSAMERLHMDRGPTRAQLSGLHQPRHQRWVKKPSDDSSFRCPVTKIARETPKWKLLTDPNQALVLWAWDMWVEMLWNLESQNTPRRTLSTVEHSLFRQRVQGESIPNKAPEVSERPSFIPRPAHVTSNPM